MHCYKLHTRNFNPTKNITGAILEHKLMTIDTQKTPIIAGAKFEPFEILNQENNLVHQFGDMKNKSVLSEKKTL